MTPAPSSTAARTDVRSLCHQLRNGLAAADIARSLHEQATDPDVRSDLADTLAAAAGQLRDLSEQLCATASELDDQAA